MFQFSTTTVINSAAQYAVHESGSKKVFRVLDGPAFKSDKNDDTVEYCVWKAPFVEAKEDVITVDPTKYTGATDIYRIYIYVRSQGNADPLFANDYVFKGKPFMIEFKGGTTADQLKTLADKYQLALFDTPQMAIESKEGKLVITLANSYQRAHKAIVEKWTPDTVIRGEGEWVDTAISGGITVVEGAPGYGTYEQIMKDLRLPTIENVNFYSVNKEQMPKIDGEYTQYTVQMTADLVNYPGGIGVHNPTKSKTYHVFFVEAGVDEFEDDLLSVLGEDVEIIDVPKS